MQEFSPRNPDFARRTHDSFARQEFMRFLGANLASVEPGYVEIRLPHQLGLTQQHGFFHGGAIGTIADNAGGYAAYSLLLPTDSILTVEYKLNIMAPANGQILIARGRVLRPGRRVTVCQTDLWIVRDGQEHLCATMLGTFMVMPNTADDASGK